jgi:predicted secreted protein
VLVTILNNQDNGRTVEAKARSIITVRLEENPTTGYRWNVATAGGLELLGDSFEKGGEAIGAAGTRIFQFRTPESGSHKLSIQNWRDWEGESSIIDQFYAIIEIK